jgi:hypothetical protein
VVSLNAVKLLEKLTKFDKPLNAINKGQVLETVVEIMSKKEGEEDDKEEEEGGDNEQKIEREKKADVERLTGKQNEELRDCAIKVLQRVTDTSDIAKMKKDLEKTAADFIKKPEPSVVKSLTK